MAHGIPRPGASPVVGPGGRSGRRPQSAAQGEPPHRRARRPTRVEQRPVRFARRSPGRHGHRSLRARSCLRAAAHRIDRSRCRSGAARRAGARRRALRGDGGVLRGGRAGRQDHDVQHRLGPGQRRARRRAGHRRSLATGQCTRADAERVLCQLAVQRGPAQRVGLDPVAGVVAARSQPGHAAAVGARSGRVRTPSRRG
jgi:hypothetical protein